MSQEKKDLFASVLAFGRNFLESTAAHAPSEMDSFHSAQPFTPITKALPSASSILTRPLPSPEQRTSDFSKYLARLTRDEQYPAASNSLNGKPTSYVMAASPAQPDTPAQPNTAPKQESLTIFGFDLGFNRDRLIRQTDISNQVSVTSSFAGYVFSAGNGLVRLFNPASKKTPPLATSLADASKLGYNNGTTALSLGRFLTTYPEMRDDPYAKFWAYASNGFSLASLASCMLVNAAFLPTALNPLNKFPLLQALARDKMFNLSSALGTVAASAATVSETEEIDLAVQTTAGLLADRKEIPLYAATNIIKTTAPHPTADELAGKAAGYGLSFIAALGGLCEFFPTLKEKRPDLYDKLAQYVGSYPLRSAENAKTIGDAILTSAAKWGGVANGVGYAFAFVLAAYITHNGYDITEQNPERRVPSHLNEQHKALHKRAFYEAGFATAALGLSILALRSGKIKTPESLGKLLKANPGFVNIFSALIPTMGLMALNKLDVIVVGGIGGAQIAAHPDQPIPTSLLQTAGNSRRIWLGPRISIIKTDMKNWLDKTDPAKYSSEQIATFIDGEYEKVVHKGTPGSDQLTTEQKRDFLVKNRYKHNKTPNGKTYEPTTNDDPNRRPVWAGARHAEEALSKADKWLQENPDWNPKERKWAPGTDPASYADRVKHKIAELGDPIHSP